MFKRIPGNDLYLISLSGEVKRTDGQECTLPINCGKVEMDIYGKKGWYWIDWLSMMAHYEVILPWSLMDRLMDICFIPADKRIAGSLNGKMMKFDRPMVVVLDSKIFRIVPGFVEFAVAADSHLIFTMSGRDVPVALMEGNPKTYPTVDALDRRKGSIRSYGLHRFVALAWLKNQDSLVLTTVNHKDGNKKNCAAYNLEWTTQKLNVEHAYENGLRKDNIRVKVRDVRNGEIGHFPSISKAGEALGITTAIKSHQIFSSKKNRLVKDRYEFKREEDESPWFFENIDAPVKKGRYITTISFDDGGVETFYDLRDVVWTYKLWNMDKGISANSIKLRMAEDYPTAKVDIVDQFDTRPIQAYRIETGETFEAPSIRGLSRLLKIERHRIQVGLRNKETMVTDGFAFRRKTDVPWDTNFTANPYKPVCIQAVHEPTGTVESFSSLREAAKRFGISRQTVVYRAATNKPVDGWILREN